MSPRRQFDLVLRSRRVVLPDGDRGAAVCVSGGVIAAILPYDAPAEAARDLQFDDLALLPGVVDVQGRVDAPAGSEATGFAAVTRAAALGGVTTLIDLPFGAAPATTTAGAFAAKRAAVKERISVDVGLWGGAVPGNRSELPALHEAGAFGFACFLAGRAAPDLPALDSGEFEAAARRAAELGALLLAGAADHLAPQSAAAETETVTQVLAVARRTGARISILHLCSPECLSAIEEAKAGGARITAATCLCRPAADPGRLWAALGSGLVDFADFGRDAAASPRPSLPAVWAEARRHGWSLAQVAELTARRPADFAGLPHKGRIAVGCDADLLVFDPDAAAPHDDGTLTGAVMTTYLRGRPVSATPHGKLLRRIVTGPRVVPAPEPGDEPEHLTAQAAH